MRPKQPRVYCSDPAKEAKQRARMLDYRTTRDAQLRHQGGDKKESIDLGLALLAALVKPGERLTQHDIAAWCGCTNAMVHVIERKALHRLRQRLNIAVASELGRNLGRVIGHSAA